MPNYYKIIQEALLKTISENGYQGALKNRNIHERTLSHRLAVHLENSGYFNSYNIDCEYNRFEEQSKINENGNLIMPDIIIHFRGNQDNNLIMIQTKKFNDSNKEIEDAKRDLIEDKEHLKYKFAFLVTFPETEILESSIIEV